MTSQSGIAKGDIINAVRHCCCLAVRESDCRLTDAVRPISICFACEHEDRLSKAQESCFLKADVDSNLLELTQTAEKAFVNPSCGAGISRPCCRGVLVIELRRAFIRCRHDRTAEFSGGVICFQGGRALRLMLAQNATAIFIASMSDRATFPSRLQRRRRWGGSAVPTS